jgi:hypothetical protein
LNPSRLCQGLLLDGVDDLVRKERAVGTDGENVLAEGEGLGTEGAADIARRQVIMEANVSEIAVEAGFEIVLGGRFERVSEMAAHTRGGLLVDRSAPGIGIAWHRTNSLHKGRSRRHD